MPSRYYSISLRAIFPLWDSRQVHSRHTIKNRLIRTAMDDDDDTLMDDNIHFEFDIGEISFLVMDKRN